MKTEPLKVDPDVQIPAAVKAAAARADEAFRVTYSKNAPVTPDPAPAPTPTPAAEVVPPVVPPVVPVTPEVVAPRADETSFEHKYNSMKGRHDRLVDQVRAMSSTISNLQGVIATMQPAAPTALPTTATASVRLITPEEENDYGVDLLKVVGKKAQEEITPELNALKFKMEALEGRLNNVGGHVAKDARQRMEETLDQRCPTWREVNFDEKFKEWLQLPDLYSGAIRHNLLKAAYEQNDTPRTLAFFQGFLAEEAATAPATPEPDLTAAPPAPQVPKIPLESLAAPGRAKTAAATPPTEKPIFTRTQIAEFYVDVRAGKFRGKDAEKDAIERQIFLAQNEGRIR